VPVWEKLDFDVELKRDCEMFTCVYHNFDNDITAIASYHKTIQEAAAHATAKTIIELKK
jgi:hypothetical protein